MKMTSANDQHQQPVPATSDNDQCQQPVTMTNASNQWQRPLSTTSASNQRLRLERNKAEGFVSKRNQLKEESIERGIN